MWIEQNIWLWHKWWHSFSSVTEQNSHLEFEFQSYKWNFKLSSTSLLKSQP